MTLVGAGVTVHEALRAADRLATQGFAVRVIDCYSVKPIDAETLRAAARATGGRVVVAEDHWPEGGVADAVLEALTDSDFVRTLQAPLAAIRLAVGQMPGSAKPEEQLAAAGIDSDHIVEAAAALVSPIAPQVVHSVRPGGTS